jgi:hypothetical protein
VSSWIAAAAGAAFSLLVSFSLLLLPLWAFAVFAPADCFRTLFRIAIATKVVPTGQTGAGGATT